MVLFLPETKTLSCISESMWEKKAKELKNKGYEVISCPYNKVYTVRGTKFVDLTAEEVMYVGMNCNSVYSIRNGFCELLMKRGVDLHVFYPSHNAHFIYSINVPGLKDTVREKIILEPARANIRHFVAPPPVKPLLFGVVRIPDRVYRFYDRHRHIFRNQKLIRFFVKWR